MSCRDCVFRGIFQDMGASSDVCKLHTSLVDAVAACEHSDSCKHRFTIQEAKQIVIERNGGLPTIIKEKVEPKPNDHSDPPYISIGESFSKVAEVACDALNKIKHSIFEFAKIDLEEVNKKMNNQDKTRDFKCENGFNYKMPEHHCVFCDHCTDIFYDSYGPYLCLCDLGHDDFETCGMFESEDTE